MQIEDINIAHITGDDTGIGAQLLELLRKALEGVHEHGGTASVALALKAKHDSETGNIVLGAALKSTCPTSSITSRVTQLPAVRVLALSEEVTGQCSLFSEVSDAN